MTNVIAFRAPLRVIEQSSVGTYGYPAPEPIRPRVDVTACFGGYRVWVDDRPHADFNTLSNAARCAAKINSETKP